MMWWNTAWDWMNGLSTTLMMLVVWAGVLWLIVVLLRQWSGGGGSGGGSPSGSRAEDVLAERFARGEIDEGEYQHRLRVLRDARALHESRRTGA